MLSPIFTTDETCDDKLVIEDYWIVPFAVDVFYLADFSWERMLL